MKGYKNVFDKKRRMKLTSGKDCFSFIDIVCLGAKTHDILLIQKSTWSIGNPVASETGLSNLEPE